jgi:hypothetical protein
MRNYLRFRIGLLAGSMILGGIGLVAIAAGIIFASIALFIFAEQRYGTICAYILLSGIYVLIALSSFLILALRKRRLKRERLESSIDQTIPRSLLDPNLLRSIFEGFRILSAKRAVYILALGAGIALAISDFKHAQRLKTKL